MHSHYQRFFFSLALLAVYCLLLYFILTHHQKVDFFSFYSTASALFHGQNPYLDLNITPLSSENRLPTNLNPPIVLLLFSPLTYLSYSNALVLWCVLSIILGFLGALLVFRCAFTPMFLEKNYFNLSMLYFAFFATLMNVATLQLGTLLFFFIMVGYYCYLNQRDYFAGIFWGLIIAIKLFPALLFFYVIKQKRFNVLGVMLITSTLASLIPLLFYGVEIYQEYYTMMSGMYWYGDGWNASIYGFFRRLAYGFKDYSFLINLIYGGCFCFLLIWYFKNLGPNEKNPINHQPFCLTLAMMLFLSPLSWVYYSLLLILPLVLTWFNNKTIKTMFFWLSSFFLINFPLDYVKVQNMSHFWERISFFSIYFYGLLLLIILLGANKVLIGNNEVKESDPQNQFMPICIIILILGLFIPMVFMVKRFFQLN